MKLKNFIPLLALLPLLSFADINDMEEERMKILDEAGLPRPGSGIKLIPRAMLNLSTEEMERGLNEERQMQDKGYIEENTSRPQELLNFKNYAKLQLKTFSGIKSDTGTYIRRDVKELKLAFKPVTLSKTIAPVLIGAVPQGGYHQEGWSGSVQFFENNKVGGCAYAQRSVKISQTAAQLTFESVIYEVNNKPSLYEVRGNKNSGFTYRIRWFDNVNFHELECGNSKYSKEIKDNFINLAKEIDSSYN